MVIKQYQVKYKTWNDKEDIVYIHAYTNAQAVQNAMIMQGVKYLIKVRMVVEC